MIKLVIIFTVIQLIFSQPASEPLTSVEEGLANTYGSLLMAQQNLKENLQDYFTSAQTCSKKLKSANVASLTSVLDELVGLLENLQTVDEFKSYDNFSTCDDIDYKINKINDDYNKCTQVRSMATSNQSQLASKYSQLYSQYAANIKNLGGMYSTNERMVFNLINKHKDTIQAYKGFSSFVGSSSAKLDYYIKLLATYKDSYSSNAPRTTTKLKTTSTAKLATTKNATTTTKKLITSSTKNATTTTKKLTTSSSKKLTTKMPTITTRKLTTGKPKTSTSTTKKPKTSTKTSSSTFAGKTSINTKKPTSTTKSLSARSSTRTPIKRATSTSPSTKGSGSVIGNQTTSTPSKNSSTVLSTTSLSTSTTLSMMDSSTTTTGNSCNDTIASGQCLSFNDALIYSCNGCFVLKFQIDGNMVIYPSSTIMSNPLWASDTNTRRSLKACMQEDGNFVIYNKNNQATFATNTMNVAKGGYAKLQNDGQFVIISGSHQLFRSFKTGSCPDSTATQQPTIQPCITMLKSGECLIADSTNTSLISCNRCFELKMQGDGNLVLYTKTGTPYWHAATRGSTANKACMETSGNFVVRGWFSFETNTANNPGAIAVLRDDGYFMIMLGTKELWKSTTTSCPSSDIDNETTSIPSESSTSTDDSKILTTSSLLTSSSPAISIENSTFSSLSTSTTEKSCNDTIFSNQCFSFDDTLIYSCNGCFVLKFQFDGNMVIYPSSTIMSNPLWATNTHEQYSIVACMQSDGNFVIFSEEYEIIFSTDTQNPNGGYGKLQNDGQFVVISGTTEQLFTSSKTGSCPDPTATQPPTTLSTSSQSTETLTPPIKSSSNDTIIAGQCISFDDSVIYSSNGCFHMKFQRDGNMVIYETMTSKVLWHTGTSQGISLKACMLFDGNFVLYNVRNEGMFVTKTNDVARGGYAKLQNDGQFVIISGTQQLFSTYKTGSCPVTTTVTAAPTIRPCITMLKSGACMVASSKNASLFSCNRCFELRMQSDGNLVLYTKTGTAYWYSATPGSTARKACMETGGNFVVQGSKSFETNTANNPGAIAVMRDDGYFMIMLGTKELWKSLTTSCPA